MRKLNKRETIILVVLISVVVLSMLWLLVIKPMREGGSDIDDQLRVNRQRLIKAKKMVALKPSLDERYNHIKDLVGIAGSEGSEMTAMVSKVEAAAREANIHIANMQPQKSTTEGSLRFFAVELQIDGQWADIVRFLYLAQQQPNYYLLNELNLEKYSDVTGSLRGRITLSKMRLIKP